MTKRVNEWLLDKLPSVWPWTKHLNSLGSNFLIQRMRGLNCCGSKALQSSLKWRNILQSAHCSHVSQLIISGISLQQSIVFSKSHACPSQLQHSKCQRLLTDTVKNKGRVEKSGPPHSCPAACSLILKALSSAEYLLTLQRGNGIKLTWFQLLTDAV